MKLITEVNEQVRYITEEKEGKKWKDLPQFWLCPDCGCHKDEYVKV